jgi:ribonuclease HI
VWTVVAGKPGYGHGNFFAASATNNEAEYRGVIAGLERARALLDASDGDGVQFVTLFTDSELIVRQLLGEYAVRSALLRPLYTQASVLLDELRAHVEIVHVARRFTSVADALVNRALDTRSTVNARAVLNYDHDDGIRADAAVARKRSR